MASLKGGPEGQCRGADQPLVSPHVAGLLLGGTAATLVSKVLLSTRVLISGNLETFAKPAFVTFLVYVSFVSTLPIGVRRGVAWEHATPETCWRCLMLSILGITSVTLLQSGLVLVPASSSLMLRMSSIAFTALFRRLIFGRRLDRKQVLGIWMLVLALAIVTWSVWQRSAGPRALLGCGMTLLAQVIRGVILVTEEHFMKTVPPFVVLIGEGFFGIVVMLVAVFPLLSSLPGGDAGAVESFPGTLDMLRRSCVLDALACVYLVVVTWESASGIMVTALLSSVHRSFLQFGVRIMTVWLAGLILFWLSGGEYGEPWDASSYVQLLGFAVLLASAALYFGAAQGGSSRTPPNEPLLRVSKA